MPRCVTCSRSSASTRNAMGWRPERVLLRPAALVRFEQRGVPSTFRRFWLPLLRAKLGESWPDANAAFIWATIQRLYAARRSGLKKEMFGYVPGGYARVLERFASVLGADGVDIRCSSTVEHVRRTDAGLEVSVEGGVPQHFDHVVVTSDT